MTISMRIHLFKLGKYIISTLMHRPSDPLTSSRLQFISSSLWCRHQLIFSPPSIQAWVSWAPSSTRPHQTTKRRHLTQKGWRDSMGLSNLFSLPQPQVSLSRPCKATSFLGSSFIMRRPNTRWSWWLLLHTMGFNRTKEEEEGAMLTNSYSRYRWIK